MKLFWWMVANPRKVLRAIRHGYAIDTAIWVVIAGEEDAPVVKGVREWN
jgi:hypothetical protein